jgi:hypothetical protein
MKKTNALKVAQPLAIFKPPKSRTQCCRPSLVNFSLFGLTVRDKHKALKIQMRGFFEGRPTRIKHLRFINIRGPGLTIAQKKPRREFSDHNLGVMLALRLTGGLQLSECLSVWMMVGGIHATYFRATADDQQPSLNPDCELRACLGGGPYRLAGEERGIFGDGSDLAPIASGIFQDGHRFLDSRIGPTRAERGELGWVNQDGEVPDVTGAVRHDRQDGSEQEGQDAEYHGRMISATTMPGNLP